MFVGNASLLYSEHLKGFSVRKAVALLAIQD
jgi:hypothetical protein